MLANQPRITQLGKDAETYPERAGVALGGGVVAQTLDSNAACVR